MKFRSVLVLQLCRMGDILQTSPMLRGLRREHPEAAITLAVLDRFASTPLPTHLYDRLVVFPMKDMCAGLAAGEWQAQVDRLDAFLAEIGDTPIDCAINLTQTDLSAALMFLVPSMDQRGPVATAARRRAVANPWMRYFWSMPRCRAMGSFNLVDLYTWSAGVGCDGQGLDIAVPDAAEDRTRSWLEEHRLLGRPIIVMQLGASTEEKRYPAERYARTADLLPEECGEIVLVGSEAERPLGERFRATARRAVHDSIGALGVPELAALLKQARLLVTNDTGPMHVATAVGTRVVDISTGSVFVHETGPYGEGHLVVQPDIDCFPCAAGATCHHMACHDRLRPDDVAAVIRYALNEGPPPRLTGARLLAPRRAASGCLEYWPVAPSRVTTVDLIRFHWGRVWEATLPTPAPVASAAGVEQGVPPLSSVMSLDEAEETRRTLGMIAAKCTTAAGLVRRLPSAAPRQQARLAAEAHQHLEELRRLGETARFCYPVVGFLIQEIESSTAKDLSSLAREQAGAYAATAHRARLLADRLRATEPVAAA